MDKHDGPSFTETSEAIAELIKLMDRTLRAHLERSHASLHAEIEEFRIAMNRERTVSAQQRSSRLI